ncbi:MAG: MoaD/ThiS family protein [Phaeodactylibacter sp.]|nr:MoaD/ThiS family protein [Phaeodactylibacter sp.]MCB9049367.1 MoaD/ThiS family protein [Lewinellaceae bacterium]
MPTVRFTTALRRFFPSLKEQEVAGGTVAEVLEEVESLYPGIKDYVLDEQGRLRQHVNIFLSGELIEDKETLQDRVRDKDEVYVFQALSGG